MRPKTWTSRGNRYVPRTYRVVRLRIGEQAAWVVVSESLRYDTTWDVIARFDCAGEALAYVEEVTERNRTLAELEGSVA